MLPRHITPERILKAAIVAATKNKKLFGCTQLSVVKALMDETKITVNETGTLVRISKKSV